MDKNTAFFILLSVAFLAILFVYITSRITIKRCKTNIKNGIEKIQQEPLFHNERHILFYDIPELRYVFGQVGLSVLSSSIIVLLYLAQSMNSLDTPDTSGYVIALIVFNLVLLGAYNIAQLLYDTTIVVVTEEGLEERKLNRNEQRTAITMQWGQIVGVSCGVSRTNPDNVRIVIKSEREKIALWAYWINFEYLADGILKYGPKGGADRVYRVFERRSKEVSCSKQDGVNEWNFLSPKQSSKKAYILFFASLSIVIVILAAILSVGNAYGPNVVLENISVKVSPTTPSDPNFKYVIITGTIDNQYNAYHLISPEDFELKTNSGGDYHYSSAIHYSIPDRVDAKSKVTFQVGFEIPINDTPSIFKYQWGGFQYSEARCPEIS